MPVSRSYLVRGRVQGVGFRFHVAAAALREGVHGFVRNLSDGGVEVAAEGELDAVLRLERAIRCGPPGARVDSVETEYHEPAARTEGFSIRS